MSKPSIGNGYGLAENVVCVDFDGTITQWGGLDAENPVLQPGVVEAMRALRTAGKRIVIFSSRLSYKWLQYEGRTEYDQYHYIRDILSKNDIPFDDITSEKVPAEAYIDDMAVGFRGNWTEALAVLGIKPTPGHYRKRAERTPNGRSWCSCGWVGVHRDFRAHLGEAVAA